MMLRLRWCSPNQGENAMFTGFLGTFIDVIFIGGLFLISLSFFTRRWRFHVFLDIFLIGVCILLLATTRKWEIVFILLFLMPPYVDALIRTCKLSKRTFRCKDCGNSFTMKWHKLFGALLRWKAPVEMKNGKETESNAYERAYIKCPKCGSDTCVLWMDE
jgi:ribosomal protein S27E